MSPARLAAVFPPFVLSIAALAATAPAISTNMASAGLLGSALIE